MTRLTNKIALITGAARGIGAATARVMAQEGATVIITDILDGAGEQVAAEIGSQAIYHHLDVCDESKWQALFQFIEKEFGRLDVLFNNAGITGLSLNMGSQDPEHASLDAWHKVHCVNLDGTFLGCKYAIGFMKEHGGGAIINMSSRSGLVGVPDIAAYASSKAAIRNHTKTVALYCAKNNYNIRCNSVHPASVLTPIWDPMLGASAEDRDKAIERMASTIPLHRMGEPEDVAWAVVYLASDESSYLTGIELTIDGGILAGSAASPSRSE